MKVICMGTPRKKCGKYLGDKEGPNDAISHGLCEQCFKDTLKIMNEEDNAIKQCINKGILN